VKYDRKRTPSQKGATAFFTVAIFSRLWLDESTLTKTVNRRRVLQPSGRHAPAGAGSSKSDRPFLGPVVTPYVRSLRSQRA
jgi:hypothetical protein